jgi:hypothetical protein
MTMWRWDSNIMGPNTNTWQWHSHCVHAWGKVNSTWSALPLKWNHNQLCECWPAASKVAFCYCHRRWHGWDCSCSCTSWCLFSGIQASNLVDYFILLGIQFVKSYMHWRIPRGRGRPRKTIRETVKNDLKITSWIKIWFIREHYGVIWSM